MSPVPSAPRSQSGPVIDPILLGTPNVGGPTLTTPPVPSTPRSQSGPVIDPILLGTPNVGGPTLTTPPVPSTPLSQSGPAIDTSILDTPGLDTSRLTHSSPPSPQTPEVPGRSSQHSSPLSNISGGSTSAEKTKSLKRKRPTLNGDRPKAKPRARRKSAQA
jgi:hypothetical protein